MVVRRVSGGACFRQEEVIVQPVENWKAAEIAY